MFAAESAFMQQNTTTFLPDYRLIDLLRMCFEMIFIALKFVFFAAHCRNGGKKR